MTKPVPASLKPAAPVSAFVYTSLIWNHLDSGSTIVRTPLIPINTALLYQIFMIEPLAQRHSNPSYLCLTLVNKVDLLQISTAADDQ